jgi:16S rRNA (guanine527-N7)-methyltransferase
MRSLLVALVCCDASAFLQASKTKSSVSACWSSQDDTSFSTSVNFAMDPTSVEAKKIMNHLGLSLDQHQQLAALAVLVNDWNTRINLISRKDCSKEVVFGRHILPSLALMGLENIMIQECEKVVDVGTGGGFPGLPLAIAYPDVQFTLVDSVGKKLAAVEDMAKRLELKNVQIHHGRAEALKGEFDMCVGRSVAAIPTFCFWVQRLLKKKGHLVYLIGGDIDHELLEQTLDDRNVDDLLNFGGASDKRVLVFPQASVKKIAASSGEKLRVPINQKVALGGKNKKKQPKGAWEKRDNSQPKNRGYENFKRYDNLNP